MPKASFGLHLGELTTYNLKVIVFTILFTLGEGLMTTDVENTDEFEEWWGGLDESEQESVEAVVQLRYSPSSRPKSHRIKIEAG